MQETIFHGVGKPHEVFLSAHIEPRASLSSVIRRCSVRVEQPGARVAAPSPADDGIFVCMYFYDIDTMSLRALTAAECSTCSGQR